jgi:hypothetical protein
MHQYGLGLATPGAAGVLVITDQLLFFFVSTLMIGSPAASNCARCSAMCRNWASRSGGELRASVRRALTLGE